MVTSGIRLGSPAGTTRGFGEAEFRQIGDWINEVVDGLAANGEGRRNREAKVKAEVAEMCAASRSTNLTQIQKAGAVLRPFLCAAGPSAGHTTPQQRKRQEPQHHIHQNRHRHVDGKALARVPLVRRLQIHHQGQLRVLKGTGLDLPLPAAACSTRTSACACRRS